VISVLPNDLNVAVHSDVFILHNLTEPSELALKKQQQQLIFQKECINYSTNLKILWLSTVKIALLTNETCPRNSFITLPDFNPCILQIIQIFIT